MSDELALPPPLQDVKWLDLGDHPTLLLVIRPCAATRKIYDELEGRPIHELWSRLTTKQRRDLLQISLIITRQLHASSKVCATIGGFTLYEDDEIRYERGPL